ncbi:MAG: hypothetical protein NT029_01030 [Armatimonadetes bacterium]|nr:hypothetical protein [Armatimonadota bacterium]
MSRRDLVLSILDGSAPQGPVPAAFFSHFDPSCHFGQAGVDKHLEFVRATGMDFVKIQYERKFPSDPSVERPADWADVKPLTLEYFEPQLSVVRGLVEACKAEMVVVVTLYSPFMCAGHVGGAELLAAHMAEDPDAACKGMEIVTESLRLFVRECIRIGVDGFYHSTQGYEAGRLASRELFHRCVKPYDLSIMEEIDRSCPFSILHVCDYHDPYDDISPFPAYPGKVVNINPQVGDTTYTGARLSAAFGRPFMGGMDRYGALAKGTEAEVRAAAREALAAAPERFILAADCTVPPGTQWANLRAAIDEAHNWRR